MKECEIIRDLLPLYVDELTSEESNALIQRHLETCSECRAELTRMRSAVAAPEAEQMQNVDYKKALKSQLRRMKLKITGTTLVGVLIAAVIVLLVLWWNGVFCIVERKTSPDGHITVTAYSQDVTNMFHPSDGFSLNRTIPGSLFLRQQAVYGGTYKGMWWSYDSQYLVLAAETEDGLRLKLAYGGGAELNWCLSNTPYSFPEQFPNLPYDGSKPEMEYEFVQWSDDSHNMLIRYTYIGTDGIDRAGYFWFDLDTWSSSGVMSLPREAARGQIKSSGTHQDGSPFYVMDLAELDEDGNTVEFVFTVTGATDIRNTQSLKEGDYVLVVYQENEALYDFPAISVTRTTSDYAVKHEKTYGDP